MHQAISQLFFCTDRDLREYKNSGPELEANTFAAEMLMPKHMIDPELLKAEPNWEVIEQITRQFNVAPISAAIRYAELSKHSVIAVFTDRRNVRWWRENRTRTDGLWLESRQPISEDSVVYHGVNGPTWKPTLEPVPWEAWFPHCEAQEDAELFELAAPLDVEGLWLSLLWMPSY